MQEEKAMMSSDDNSASVEILLQFENTTLNEIKFGKPQAVIENAEVIVVSLVPTEEHVQHATSQLGLPQGSIRVGDGTPLVFLLIGEYKIPVNKSIVVLQGAPNDFTFVLPKLFLQVLFAMDAPIEELDALEHVIFSYGTLRKKPQQTSAGGARSAAVTVAEEPQHPKAKISTRIAIGLGRVTQVACAGVTKGAEIVSHSIGKGADKIVVVTEPCKEAMKVSESTKGHIQRARVATKSVAMLSGGVATAMVGITAVVGNFIGGRVANRIASSDEHGGTTDRLAAVKEVGGAAIGCVGLLFDTASDAGKVILTSSCEGISKVVTHKLGEEAGQTTANGLGVVSDVYQIQTNVRKAGIKGIASATAQSSAVSMIGHLEKKEQERLGAAQPQ
jgi:hypothetical protein